MQTRSQIFFGYVPFEDYDGLVDELENVEERYHDLVTDSDGYHAAFQFLNLLGFHSIGVRNIEDQAANTVTGHFGVQYDLDVLTKALAAMGFNLTPNEHFDKSDPSNPALIDTTKDDFVASPPATEVVEEIDDPDPLTAASDPESEMEAKRFDDTVAGQIPPASSE